MRNTSAVNNRVSLIICTPIMLRPMGAGLTDLHKFVVWSLTPDVITAATIAFATMISQRALKNQTTTHSVAYIARTCRKSRSSDADNDSTRGDVAICIARLQCWRDVAVFGNQQTDENYQASEV